PARVSFLLTRRLDSLRRLIRLRLQLPLKLLKILQTRSALTNTLTELLADALTNPGNILPRAGKLLRQIPPQVVNDRNNRQSRNTDIHAAISHQAPLKQISNTQPGINVLNLNRI